MNNTQQTTVELESLEIIDLNSARLHVYPYDPSFVDRSWSHDGEGNLHTYDVVVSLSHDQDEDDYGRRHDYIEDINVVSVQATDVNGNNVVHTPSDHGRVLRWIENNYEEIDNQFSDQAERFFSDY